MRIMVYAAIILCLVGGFELFVAWVYESETDRIRERQEQIERESQQQIREYDELLRRALT